MTTLAWIGWQEILLICLVLVIIFGKRLPEVGRSLGRGLVEFKKGLSGVKESIEEPDNESGESHQSAEQSDKEA